MVMRSLFFQICKTTRRNSLKAVHSHQSDFHFSKSNAMPIKVGDKIPSIDLFEHDPTQKVNIGKLCEGKKVILFGVPGAFTPGCSKTHLPGFVEKSDEFRKKGVAEIICVSVNDPFVMDAWAEKVNTQGKVRLLADPLATFTKAVDLQTNLPPLGGIRSKRYSMVIDNCIVKTINIEADDAGTGLTCSLAKELKI